MRRLLGLAMAGAGLFYASAGIHGAEPPEPPQAGDTAPPFSLPGSDGKTHDLSEIVGQRAVVVAWFPKAFTGG